MTSFPPSAIFAVKAITVEKVCNRFAILADRPDLADLASSVLSMMHAAEPWGCHTHDSSPCKNTKRYLMKLMESLLTANEMARPVSAHPEP